MEQTDNPSLMEYISTLWRRKWLFLLVSIFVLAACVFIITKLPVVYRSTGTILIERQDIPEQWVNSTITTFAAERIQTIGQRVLTTDNFSRIIEQYDLFPNKRKQFTMDELANFAKDDFFIENVRRTGPNNTGTAAFRVSYQAASAEIARDVANEMIALYLSENKKSRTLAATDTRRFLEGEANRLEGELKTIEEEISNFKEVNLGVLPENQSINIQAYERVEQQIASIDSTLKSLEDRKVVIESSIASARRVLLLNAARSGDAAGTTSPRQQLNVLRTQYANLQTRYSSAHPDLKRMSREIELLEAQVGSSADDGQSSLDDTAVIQLKSDLKSTINERKSLVEHKLELADKLDDLEVRINKTPGVELEYRTLLRDHENTQNKYNDIRSKQNSARVSQSLEEEQKGERFTLIEAARAAAHPYSPNYPKAYVMAISLALLTGLGAVFGLEKLNGTIRNVRSLKKLTGVPVIVTVGYIEDRHDLRRRMFKKIAVYFLLICLVLGGLYLRDFYKMNAGIDIPQKILDLVPEWIASFELPR